MILIDTSAWVDYLRSARGRARDEVHRLVSGTPDELVMCEPVACELLAGPVDESIVATLEQLVNGLPSIAVDPVLDFRTAAGIYRNVRKSGRTVRSLNDCLIAAVALSHDAILVHKDVDFDVISEVTGLRVHSLL